MFYPLGDSFLQRQENGDVKFYHPGNGRGDISATEVIIPKEVWVQIVTALTLPGDKWQSVIQAEGTTVSAEEKEICVGYFKELTGHFTAIHDAVLCEDCSLGIAYPDIITETEKITCEDCGKLLCPDCALYCTLCNPDTIGVPARCEECSDKHGDTHLPEVTVDEQTAE